MDREKTQVAAAPQRAVAPRDAPEVDKATKRSLRLAALGFALESGTYRVPAAKLADKLIDRLRKGN